ALFNEMRTLQAASGKKIAACSYADTIGTPVLFTEAYFDALEGLGGNEGAKHIAQQHHYDVARVPFAQGAIDIDTEDDYTALLQ
ncbi:nucleotidyltransferase family protein, partial [Escherichia coli]|nr:nucleotidyltransferase family protein [Escherichia coli]